MVKFKRNSKGKWCKDVLISQGNIFTFFLASNLSFSLSSCYWTEAHRNAGLDQICWGCWGKPLSSTLSNISKLNSFYPSTNNGVEAVAYNFSFPLIFYLENFLQGYLKTFHFLQFAHWKVSTIMKIITLLTYYLILTNVNKPKS